VIRAHELGILTEFMASVRLITEAKSPFIASVLKDPRLKAWCWWHFWKFESWCCLYGIGSVNNRGQKPFLKIWKLMLPYMLRFSCNRGQKSIYCTGL